MNELTADPRDHAHQANPFGPAVVSSCAPVPSLTDALVDPAGVFEDPAAVVEHPWFSDEEKRTILISWARDELLLEQMAQGALPELRCRSRIEAVLEALSRFDAQAASEYRAAVAGIRGMSPGSVSWMQISPAGRRARRTSGGEPCRNA